MMNYKTYDEIPVWMEDYVLTVSGERSITDIPISDINGFLDGMTKFEQMVGEPNGTGTGRTMGAGDDGHGVRSHDRGRDQSSHVFDD